MKYGLKIKNMLFILLGIVMTVLPLSVKADDITVGNEDPKYEISFKFYKASSEYETKFDGGKGSWARLWEDEEEEEITADTEIKAGDLVVVAPTIKIISGKTADATLFNVYFKWDTDVFETNVQNFILNENNVDSRGPFPNNTIGSIPTWTIDKPNMDTSLGMTSISFSDPGYSTQGVAPYDNVSEFPLSLIHI